MKSVIGQAGALAGLVLSGFFTDFYITFRTKSFRCFIVLIEKWKGNRWNMYGFPSAGDAIAYYGPYVY